MPFYCPRSTDLKGYLFQLSRLIDTGVTLPIRAFVVTIIAVVIKPVTATKRLVVLAAAFLR